MKASNNSLEAAAAALAGSPIQSWPNTLWSSLNIQVMALLLSVLSLPFLAKFFYDVFIYPFCTSSLRSLPGPKDNAFFLGQSSKFLQVPWLPQLFLRWSTAWPGTPFIRYLGFANSETILASNLEAYRQVLQTKNHHFVKPDMTRRTANVVIGEGLPFTEGQLHRQRKGALTRPFSVGRLKSFLPTLEDKSHRFVNVLSRNRDLSGEVEVESHIWKTVLDVIGIEVLGIDLNHLESDHSPLFELFSKTMQQSLLSHIIHYFNSYLPLRHLIPSRSNHEFTRSCADIRNFIRQHVKARRARQNSKHTTSEDPDALQCMIDNTSLWSDDEIVEFALNLLVLGHDTTACSLVWAVDALSRNPQCQERLRGEISDLKRTCANPDYNDIERLPYLDNFLREVLRLFCPVAYIPRQATSDVEIAGVLLPKGTTVQLSPAMMNLNKSIWGEDAELFNPDRWDHLTGDAASAYAFESFHNGPRVCLGKQLSMLEMKTVVMELVSRFRVEPLDGAKSLELACPTFTLRPKERLRVRLLDLQSS